MNLIEHSPPNDPMVIQYLQNVNNFPVSCYGLLRNSSDLGCAQGGSALGQRRYLYFWSFWTCGDVTGPRVPPYHAARVGFLGV